MDVFVSYLYEYRTRIRKQVPRYRQAVTEVSKIAVNAIPPCISKGLHLLWLAGDVAGMAILHIATGCRPLEVRVELDAIRRVQVYALDFPTKALALREARHDL